MIGIYLFEDVQAIDSSLKPFSLQLGLELQYENKASNLLQNIVKLTPEVLIVDQKRLNFSHFLLEIFNENSPFFVPAIFLVCEEPSFEVDFPVNCILVSGHQLKQKLSQVVEILHQRKKHFLKKIAFPFTQFDDITRVLLSMGFTLKNQGTVYVKDCIGHYLTEIGSFSKNLGRVLNAVGAIHETTVPNIERCIRIAIRNVWKNINPTEVANRLGLSSIFFTRRPSCRELVIFIGEYIYAKIKETRVSRTIYWNEEMAFGISQ